MLSIGWTGRIRTYVTGTKNQGPTVGRRSSLKDARMKCVRLASLSGLRRLVNALGVLLMEVEDMHAIVTYSAMTGACGAAAAHAQCIAAKLSVLILKMMGACPFFQCAPTGFHE